MLEVGRAGLLTTVQDGGRPGLGHLGVPRGGAVDQEGLAIANLLLGNTRDCATLEVTLGGLELRVAKDTVVGLGGGDLDARLMPTGRRLLPDASYRVATEETVVFRGSDDPGAVRAYVAVPGGIDVPEVLGSRSTCLTGRFGGIDGRPVQTGDVIRPRDPQRLPDPARWPRRARRAVGPGGTVVRVLPGPAHARTTRDAQALLASLCAIEWSIGADSNRMGIRLHGKQPQTLAAPELVSHGVAWGAVQLPPDGQPIVLLADHQPTGGYPVIAVVITADLPTLGQLGPAATLRFEIVDADEARQALIDARSAFDRARSDIQRLPPS